LAGKGRPSRKATGGGFVDPAPIGRQRSRLSSALNFLASWDGGFILPATGLMILLVIFLTVSRWLSFVRWNLTEPQPSCGAGELPSLETRFGKPLAGH
jgi:hypothetical protein